MCRQAFLSKAILFLLILLMGIGGLFSSPSRLSAEAIPVSTEVKHKPIKYFIPGSRIALDAKVSDESGVKIVRCYFQADEQAEYVFVPMSLTNDQVYRAILPAPADYTRKIRYLFLVVNGKQQVVKTQPFLVEKAVNVSEPPAWQEVSASDGLSVYNELSQPPEVLAGFSDSVTIDAVESSLRFGMVAGVYSASASAGSATGAAAAATSAGSITATAGISTTVILATAAGVAAGAGAIAAASGGGGGGDGGEEKVNPNASISWGDSGSPADDSFQAVLCNETLGTASSVTTRTGLPVGSFDLTIQAVSIVQDTGSFVVVFGGGAYFRDDGGIRKEGRLSEGERVIFPILVPDTGSARIEW